MNKVKNRGIIRLLSKRFLIMGKKKNIVAVLAISLTAVLFTSLFTIGGSMLKSMEEATMRQVGTKSHGGFKFITQDQYNIISKNKMVKDISYNIIIAIAENKNLSELQTEIRYSEAKCAKWGFCYPEVGKMPKEKMEIATSTMVLDALGVPYELGAKVPLEFTVHGKKYKENFTLCGYWKGDRVARAQQAWVSKEYCNKVAPVVTIPLYQSGEADVAGTINADVWFASSWDIERQMAELIQRCGMDNQYINTGVNWAYSTSSMDITSITMIVLVMVLIFISGYLIIYNIFYISVSQDIQFYGLLKTIGTTGKQLRRMVYYQAFILSGIGIPLGLIFGWLMGRALVPLVVGITSIGDQFIVAFEPWIFIGAGVFTIITVFISCIRPCRIASRISPVEAVRFVERDGVHKRKKKSRKVTPVSMGVENLSRNRKKAVVVVLSLALSMILLNSVYATVNGFDIEKFLEGFTSGDFTVSDYSILKRQSGHSTLDGVDNGFLSQVSSRDGYIGAANVYTSQGMHLLNDIGYQNVLNIMEDYKDTFPMPYAEEELRMAKEEKTVRCFYFGINQYAVSKLEISKGTIDYEKLKTGKYIILNCYYEEKNALYYDVGDKLTLDYGQGNTKEYEVMAIASVPYSMGPHFGSWLGIDFIMADTEYSSHFGKTQPMLTVIDMEDNAIADTEQWIADYCENTNPNMVYESRATYEKEFKDMQATYAIVGGALSFILALIGILNFTNATVTSVLARKKEFAMLQAVGMTGKQLKKMLITEGLTYAILTIFFTITAGSGIGYGIVKAISYQIWFYNWHFTILPIVLCIPIMLLIAYLVPVICYRNMCRQSIIERLRTME